ncbi:hypothetical protein FIBSPDRAFT_955717 [Athelia psychrophila]|uniref:Uncharacterized protein n=1 Tax=Athelia psychrophila TaxID=1759441 RepID=A0A166HSG1_9AGAM|nr:hypothetical protein FIBSPDRAFT_955717 [Fibularhizoctonia sp. CBS 109695]
MRLQEIHAGHIEGTLLGPVRVAKIGQEISSAPESAYESVVNLDPQSKSDALLLTTDTEVHIAPKLRNSAFASPKTPQAATSTHENAHWFVSAPVDKFLRRSCACSPSPSTT